MCVCVCVCAVFAHLNNSLSLPAHFHLKNGASLWRVNWMGDRSVRGLQRSLGMMVNYCYNTRDIADNGRRFRVEQSIATSDHIDSLLHK